MSSCLDEVKAAQIAARFLKIQGAVDATNYTKLVKLLYLCDREALDIWNQPLTGDKYCWIKNGPVLSGVLDRIREKVAHKTYWNTCFRTVGYEIQIVSDPGDHRLSAPERALIDRLGEQFSVYTFGAMIDYTHELPERPANFRGGSVVITYEDLLRSLGKGESASEIAEDIETCNYLRATIGANCR